jgi:hypothetical protein
MMDFGNEAGLPDGPVYFQTKNPSLGKFLEGIGMDKVGIFYGHLEYTSAIWYILWPFGNFVNFVAKFPPFWYIVSRKIWQP